MKPFYPVDMNFQIIQRFGENIKLYPKRHGHPGTDWSLPKLNNLYAVADAKVKFAGYRPESGYGREVDLLVNNRWLVIYGHLSEYHVQQGDMVKRGDVIGLSGGDPNDDDKIDGMSSCAHLHLEVRDITQPQVYPLIGAVDPEVWLATDMDSGKPQNVNSTVIHENIPSNTPAPVLSLPSASGGILYCTDTCNIRTKPDLDKTYDVGDLPTGYSVESLGEEVTVGKVTFSAVKMWVCKDYLRRG